jgi:hypothetical protein
MGMVGLRDRSWGIRDNSNADLWIWITAQFPGYHLTAWQWEAYDGRRVYLDGALDVHGEQAPLRVTDLEHRVRFAAGTRRPQGAEFVLVDAQGRRHELQAEEISTIVLGRTPARWSDRDGETYHQVSNTAIGFDQFTRFRLGGDVGYGIVEYMNPGGSRRYGVEPLRRS